MATFQYKAVDKSGKPARGMIEAINDVDLEMRLKRMGVDLITCRKIDPSSAFTLGKKITRKDLITFCFHLEQIARAGISLLDGLADLRNSIDNDRFREIITAMLEDMEGGKLLSEAMAAHAKVFDTVFSSLIRAGEQTGRLPEALQNLGATLKWQDELVMQTRRLLVYPSLIFLVVGGVIAFLMLYLVPQLVSFLKTTGQALPLQTRIVIGASNILKNYWPFVIGLPMLGGGVFFVMLRNNPRLQYAVDYVKLTAPIVGLINKKIILARFANFFALMYASGITILEALAISEGIVTNRVIADGLVRAGQQINAGENLTDSFANIGIFPPLVIRMLRVGETTGALDTALLNISYFYNREVEDTVQKALKLIEPMLTLILGSLLAIILFSVLSPIYDIIGKLKV